VARERDAKREIEMAQRPLAHENAMITRRECVAPGFWCVGFRAPRIAGAVRAAQYVAIDQPGRFAVRLPLGIWTAEGDEITVLFREWGERTAQLAHSDIGTAVDLIGPLGNDFTIPARGARATIVAGGLGVVPFWLLGKRLLAADVQTRVVLGARTAALLVGAAELRALGLNVELCTDDGTAGTRGSVLDALDSEPPADIVYGCGPPNMLRALSKRCVAANMPCEISMEETFGCSMGTCWGCVVPVRRGAKQGSGYPKAHAESRDFDYSRVCFDGTVYAAADLVWSA
jgi:dihydroorotate dehydrogenase electron transfer subunit